MFICIGPGGGIKTGQSRCFEVFKNRLEFICISSGGEGMKLLIKILIMLAGIMKLIYSMTFNYSSIQSVLISISRTRIGFIKDMPFFIICFLLRKNVYIHLHGNDFDKFYSSLFNFERYVVRLILKKTKGVLIPNSFMSKQFEGIISGVPFHLVPNFHMSSFSKVDNGYKNQMLYLSNIMVEKGIFHVIDIFDIIRREIVDVELTIVGSMMLPIELEKKFRTLIANRNIRYVERVNPDDVFRFYRDSDILLFPSCYETEASPLVLLEAMNASCVPFIFRHNNIEEVLADSIKQSTKKKSANELARKILESLTSKQQLSYLKSSNFEKAEDYSIDNYTNRIIEILGK